MTKRDWEKLNEILRVQEIHEGAYGSTEKAKEDAIFYVNRAIDGARSIILSLKPKERKKKLPPFKPHMVSVVYGEHAGFQIDPTTNTASLPEGVKSSYSYMNHFPELKVGDVVEVPIGQRGKLAGGADKTTKATVVSMFSNYTGAAKSIIRLVPVVAPIEQLSQGRSMEDLQRI